MYAGTCLTAARYQTFCLLVQELLSTAEGVGGKWAEPGEKQVVRVRVVYCGPVKVPLRRFLFAGATGLPCRLVQRR